MKKPLIALFSVALTFPLGCTVEKEVPPDPLATATGFCSAWAERACATDVVENCNANSADDCRATQTDFCADLLPAAYSSAHAGECLDAVAAAYSDAKLTPTEINLVTHLGGACAQLSKGTVAKGGSCSKSEQCDTAGGLDCIIKEGDTKGSCEEPEEIAAGEDCTGPAQVCKSGYFCSDGNCIAQRANGKTCDGDYACKPESHCVVAEGEDAATCVAKLALNETCAADGECASGYCAIGKGDTEGSCASTIVLTRTEPLCENLR